MLFLILTSKDPKVPNKRHLQKFTPQYLQHSEQLLQPHTTKAPEYSCLTLSSDCKEAEKMQCGYLCPQG